MKPQRQASSNGVALLIILALISLNLGLFRGSITIDRYFDLKKSQNVLSTAVDRLKAENDALSLEITRIKSSPSYARKVLRDKYHVTDPDEDIVFFAE